MREFDTYGPTVAFPYAMGRVFVHHRIARGIKSVDKLRALARAFLALDRVPEDSEVVVLSLEGAGALFGVSPGARLELTARHVQKAPKDLRARFFDAFGSPMPGDVYAESVALVP